MSTAAPSFEAAILARVIVPEQPSLSAEAARSLLTLGFGEEDLLKMADLAEKARRGTLSLEESREIEGFERVGSLIGLLQSKARQSLKRLGAGST